MPKYLTPRSLNNFVSFGMRKFSLLLIVFSFSLAISAQEDHGLPRYMTEEEKEMLSTYQLPEIRGIETPPAFDELRTMAEWEEVQALTITWRSYRRILKEIARAAKKEVPVIIFCESAAEVESYLNSTQAPAQQWPSLAPLDNMDNIELVEVPSNSVWIRDYGATTVYGNRVDSLLLVDWIYNRPRPLDNAIPTALGEYLDVDVYSTSTPPYDLVHVGGNFMSDGLGSGFASELVLAENATPTSFNISPKSEEDIDAIMEAYHGVSPFIKMTELPYDIISHIDMHMKILDEETILVGEYPEGIADGPQINANIDYVLNNFESAFGTPFKIIRIPMPDSPSGLWPDSSPFAAYYRTYTNGVFVNKTFIYPSYREEYDTTAARIYTEALPGYTLVPIDCDDPPEAMIAAAGAIHCITHSVGVEDPLLIVHQSLQDTEDTENPYEVQAHVEHRSGIASVSMHWRLVGNEEFEMVEMSLVGDHTYSALIPAQAAGSQIEYYIEASANSGKAMLRPMVAPEGAWSFKILGEILGIEHLESFEMGALYPNPAVDIVSLPLFSSRPVEVRIYLSDARGKRLREIYSGSIYGDRRISMRVNDLDAGIYLISTESDFAIHTRKLVVAK